MHIQELPHPAYVTLLPSGDLDANSSIFMDEAIGNLIASGKFNIHVDFSQVAYISSAGLGVFISYLDEIKSNGGKLVFSKVSESVFDVMELLGLHHLVSIVATDAEAVSFFDTTL